jgi:hypothetical protein
MRRQRHSELKRLQDSVSHIPNEVLRSNKRISNRSEHFNELYPYRFIEDVKLSIIPIGGRAYGKKQFNIKLEPSNPELERMVTSAISTEEYPYSLTERVCDFIGQCAVTLLLFSTSIYEIVYLSDEKIGKLVGFEFVHINPYSLVKSGNTMKQLLPKDYAAELGKPEQIVLKPERLLAFTLPDNLRGKLDVLIELLSALSTPTTPDFYMKELAANKIKTPYNVKGHYFMQKVALARATRFLGWNGRQLFQDEALEYYLIRRNLLFEHFIIELREIILMTLNQGIKRGGDELGFQTKIVINGLPTIADIQAANDHLQKGNMPFAEILEPFRRY